MIYKYILTKIFISKLFQYKYLLSEYWIVNIHKILYK